MKKMAFPSREWASVLHAKPILRRFILFLRSNEFRLKIFHQEASVPQINVTIQQIYIAIVESSIDSITIIFLDTFLLGEFLKKLDIFKNF